MIYFARGEGRDRPVKIGTSGCVEKRLRELGSQVGYRLSLLATMPGNHEIEIQLLSRFLHLRIEGEWFRPDPELLSYIEKVQKGRTWNPKVDASQGAILERNLRMFGINNMEEADMLVKERVPGWSLVFVKGRKIRSLDYRDAEDGRDQLAIRIIARALGVKPTSLLKRRPTRKGPTRK